MFPFWEVAIAPVLDAAGAKRVVEIGALRGEHTRRIVERLGPDCELHVIDPAPAFDPGEHERAFGGRYVFHRGLSLDVLPTLPPVDAALVDGDHNWYTVYNELRLLRDTARRQGAPLPVLVLHDVDWPYGRRDLYYDPDTVPVEHRQEMRRGGMRPGREDLMAVGGLNAHHWNAVREGGPRNGVMTALDDFLAEHDRPVRVVHLPLYFGLAIVVETDRLGRRSPLTRELDRLESAAGRGELLRVGEEVRIRALVNQHTQIRARDQRIADLGRRYLDSVVRGLAGGTGGRLAAEVHDALAGLGSPDLAGGSLLLGASPPELAVVVAAHAAAGPEPDADVCVVDTSADRREAAQAALDAAGLADRRIESADRLPPPGSPVARLVVGAGVAAGDLSDALEQVVPHMAGGVVVVSDATEPTAREEVERAAAGTAAGPLVHLPSGGVAWRVASGS